MTALLAPFHPRVVHFPIALALVGVLFLALGLLRQRERWIGFGQLSLILGGLGIIAAIITGLIDQSRAPDSSAVQAVISQHITAGIALLIATGLALYWPLRNRRLLTNGRVPWGYLALLLLIAALVLIEGWLGGQLVYRYGVGIK